MRISDWSSDVCSSDLRHVMPINDQPSDALLAQGVAHLVRSIQGPRRRTARSDRSEEHTSELQSLMRISYAVFCLKKKNHHMINTKTDQLAEYHDHKHTNL